MSDTKPNLVLGKGKMTPEEVAAMYTALTGKPVTQEEIDKARKKREAETPKK